MTLDPFHRRAGVLLHPTSLPAGTLADGERWLDFLQAAGLTLWQMLPLGIPQDDLSPYQSLSAFAVNPALLGEAPGEPDPHDPGFRAFCQAQAHWLDDYALFAALKAHHRQQPWYRWPQPLRDRHPEALTQFQATAAADLLNLRWAQYRIHQRWQALRRRAREQGLVLFGDMPLFVAHDSADVWACPRRFLLDDQGQPLWVAGVPPDYFSETGQRWGNPHYDWDFHAAEGFRWWIERVDYLLEWFDLVRIDHFRGLEAVWMIPAASPTAAEGHWQPVPGAALLETLRGHLGRLPLVAEDLGTITPEVRALKARFGLPGMAILQFAFDHFDDNPNKPKNIGPDTVVYTGTHDNDTTRGWFESLDPGMQAHVRHELGIGPDDDVVQAMIRTAFNTRANLAVIPLQDYLGLGSEARMNVPGVAAGNWRWRFAWSQLPADLAPRIHQQVEDAERSPTP